MIENISFLFNISSYNYELILVPYFRMSCVKDLERTRVKEARQWKG